MFYVQESQSLDGRRRAAMLLQQMGSDIYHAGPPGAGNAVVIDNEQLIGYDLKLWECFLEIAQMIPTHAAASAGHQSSVSKCEATGPEPDQWNPLVGRKLQIRGEMRVTVVAVIE